MDSLDLLQTLTKRFRFEGVVTDHRLNTPEGKEPYYSVTVQGLAFEERLRLADMMQKGALRNGAIIVAEAPVKEWDGRTYAGPARIVMVDGKRLSDNNGNAGAGSATASTDGARK